MLILPTSWLFGAGQDSRSRRNVYQFAPNSEGRYSRCSQEERVQQSYERAMASFTGRFREPPTALLKAAAKAASAARGRSPEYAPSIPFQANFLEREVEQQQLPYCRSCRIESLTNFLLQASRGYRFGSHRAQPAAEVPGTGL